ncbi:hypothetical protein M9H77_11523 [Catharanthus roseus]|uniref:Uncharacterized protein n=1 Tax=Catharanthus roseus TaxID=4058 RepID=A0ACC0BET8_CATRO|nr:hypothetical protein M9H77_11523 [Catharanthus roseus]
MPCLKDEPISGSPSSVPTPNSIPEPETNPELPATSSSTPDPPSIPKTLDPVLEVFDEEEEHPEAHAQALRDYQFVRDRVPQSIYIPMMNPWASNQDRWLKFECVRDAEPGHPGLPVVTRDLFMFSLPPQFKRHSRLFCSSLFFCSFSAFLRSISVSSSSPLLYRGLLYLLLSSSELRVLSPLRDRHFHAAAQHRRVSLYVSAPYRFMLDFFLLMAIVFNFGLVDCLERAVK